MSRLLISALLALIAWTPVQAQDDGASSSECDTVLSTIERLGPSRLASLDGGTWVVYEDRISRQPLRRALQLVGETHDALEGCGIEGIAPQRFGMRLPALRRDGETMTLAQSAAFPSSASGLHLDLELELLYNFAIDYPEDWFRDRIALAPKVKFWWPNGLIFSAQYAFPIRNQQPERHAQYWSSPYPNMLMAGLRKRLAPNWIGAVSTGFYERNRYGGDAQLYWISERWPIVLGGRVSATGYWSYSDGELERSAVDFWTGYVDGTLYLPWHNIRLRARSGQFYREISQFKRQGEDIKLFPGTSGEITRMFGETEIGLHAFYNGSVVYPGFRFAAPLSPRRGLKRGRVAAYPTRQHYVPYDLGRVVRGKNTGFVRPKRGELHRTELDIWGDLRMLAPEMRNRFN